MDDNEESFGKDKEDDGGENMWRSRRELKEKQEELENNVRSGRRRSRFRTCFVLSRPKVYVLRTP
jgi:hypothetical protein